LARNPAEKAILSQLDVMMRPERRRDRHVHRVFGPLVCLALRSTGGHLTAFEIDHDRAEAAREDFEKAGVGKMVTVVEGDAHKQIARLQTPIDLVFIGADKSGYVDYLSTLALLVRPGGLILAHNVDMVPDYVKAVTTNRDLKTIFYTEGAGLAVTLKKRRLRAVKALWVAAIKRQDLRQRLYIHAKAGTTGRITIDV